MSGPEGSSNKRKLLCAAAKPSPTLSGALKGQFVGFFIVFITLIGDMYQALYRTCRPEVFEEILGQEHIVRILKNQLGNDSVSHAYLFCGTRGTGKTSTARILAKGVNCLAATGRPCGVCENCVSISQGTFMDVIEIDAASNRGIDNIRELRESVKYPPAAGRRKVYIIDEVHMLSTEAFNALLKTLEEPPEHVLFILATTEPQKLPATILSRCMRLDFKRVPETVLCRSMEKICKDRGIHAEPGAIRLIAANSDGSVRDGLSILDQCISTGQTELTRDEVLEMLGSAGESALTEITEHIIRGETAPALIKIDEVLADGKDVRQLINDMISHYRSLLLSKYIKNPEDILNLSLENAARIKEQSEAVKLEDINRGILMFSTAALDARYSTQPRILLELAIVRLAEELSPGRSDVQYTKKIKQKEPEAETTKEVASEEAKATVKPETKIVRPEVKSAGSETGDHGAIWLEALDRLEQEKATFRLLRNGTRLKELNEKWIVIEAASDILKNRMEDNKDVIENIMEIVTGKRRGLQCAVAFQEKGHQEKPSPEKTAILIEKEFNGIEVEIEEE